MFKMKRGLFSPLFGISFELVKLRLKYNLFKYMILLATLFGRNSFEVFLRLFISLPSIEKICLLKIFKDISDCQSSKCLVANGVYQNGF